MAGDVVNFKFCIPLKLHSGLTGNCHEICHYSYNLPLPAILKTTVLKEKVRTFADTKI
jgi:hypothetical protein